MKVDLTPDEMKRLIKDYETERSELAKEYTELEAMYGDYQTYIKLDESHEHLMYDLSCRIVMINSRLKYLKTLYEDRANCMRILNSLYGVNSDKKENDDEN